MKTMSPDADPLPPPRPRGRPLRGDSDCRERLLVAALAAFTRLGYEGAGLRTIAAEAGCDVSMVAHHFGSKAGLWRAVAEGVVLRHEAWLAEARALVAAPLPAAERVARLTDSMMDELADSPAQVSFVTREFAEPGERLDYLVERLIRPGVEACAPLWREAMAAGVMRETDPVVLQLGLVGAFSLVLSSRAVYSRLGGREIGMDELKRELRRAVLGSAMRI